MPLVSVIIPTYNAEKTIGETILSVINQTLSDLEIIVIDDGSTDKTCQLIQTIEDSRIRLFSYQNGGVAQARNRGIAHASGEYIAFLDHDDLWTPDKLEAQVSALEQSPEAGVAYSLTIKMYSEENPIRLVKIASPNLEGNVYSQLLLGNFIGSGSNILVRKKAIKSVGKFDSTVLSNEDWDFYLRLAAKWSFVLIPKYQVIYRHTTNSMSSQIQRLEKGGVILVNKTYQSVPADLQYFKNRSFCNHYFYYSQLYLESYNNSAATCRKQVKEAYRSLSIAIKFYPKILLEKETLRLIANLLVASFLSPKIIHRLKKIKRKTLDDKLQLKLFINLPKVK